MRCIECGNLTAEDNYHEICMDCYNNLKAENASDVPFTCKDGFVSMHEADFEKLRSEIIRLRAENVALKPVDPAADRKEGNVTA